MDNDSPPAVEGELRNADRSEDATMSTAHFTRTTIEDAT
jgi:hypothetical protein